MSPAKRYAKKHAKARQRRRHTAHERLRRDQAQAQRALEALAQALHDVGVPDNLVKEIAGRLQRQQQGLGNIFGRMFPSRFGCRTPDALTRGRGWHIHLPAQMLGALPKRSWWKRLRRWGLEVLVPLWRQVQDQSPATLSRWQGTGVADDAVCKKYGQQCGVVSTWWRGQEKRVRPGLDGVLLLVVMGEGTWVVPVDVALRRPDPKGPGGPCRDTLSGGQTRLDERLAALQRRGLALPPPVVVADRWLSDSTLRRHVRHPQEGTLLVEGQSASVLVLPEGRRVKGHAVLEPSEWSWRDHPWEPRVR